METSATKMFINQTEANSGNCCGAMTLAYWKWLATGAECGDKEQQKATIQEYYGTIRFDSIKDPGELPGVLSGIHDYCNPVSMMLELQKMGRDPVFYHNESIEGLDKIYEALQLTSQRDTIKGWKKVGKLLKQAFSLDSMEAGQYFFAICRLDPGLHYVLVYKDAAKGLQYMDPHDGEFKSGLNSGLTFTNSGILPA